MPDVYRYKGGWMYVMRPVFAHDEGRLIDLFYEHATELGWAEEEQIGRAERVARSAQGVKILRMGDGNGHEIELAGVCLLERGDHHSTSHVASMRLLVRDAYRGQGFGPWLIESALEAAERDPDIMRVEARPWAGPKSLIFLRRGMKLEGTLRAAGRSLDGELHDVNVFAMIFPRTDCTT